jgi:hypothetical protein
MESPENLHEPAPNLRLGLAVAMGLSAAMWGLIYLGVASVWPWLANRPDIAVEGQGVPHLASLADQPRAQLPTGIWVKATRKRRRGPNLASRVFSPSMSVN